MQQMFWTLGKMESSNSTIGLTSLAAWEADRIIAVGFMARVPGMVGEGKGRGSKE